ncbi:winged helix-turn-helix domain-containing protein [Frigoribacterium sp. 2-23]|uniref:winged helix-turn-helix domain-containing protein n=1 Tax=Frigoribacterium sp. 2-23 TaxID=3415006 RepID=UPI003C6ED3C5
MRVSVIEDEVELRAQIVSGLTASGLAVDPVGSLADADFSMSVNRYDCVVADRGLPDGDAVDFVSALRAAGDAVPVLLLTARGRLDERVSGFEHGADDYLVKPFALEELVMRIRALTRRTQPPRASVVTVGDIQLDLARRRVFDAGVLLTLTAKEFAVLDVLAERPGEVISRSELIERCWDEATEPMSNVVDVVIGQLRRRLGRADAIETVRGAGYRLVEAP